MRNTSLALTTLSLLLAAPLAVAQPAPPPPPEPPAAPPAADPEPAAAQPAPVAEPPPPIEPAAPAPLAAEAEPPAAAPKKLSVGKEGYFQPGALLQGWFFAKRQHGEIESTFRVRRAELKIKGQIVPDFLAYEVMIDPSKLVDDKTETLPVQGQDPAPTTPGTVEAHRSTGILQDLYITFLSEYADVSIGQFKIPVSWEGYNSSKKLLFPERALSSKQFGDRRDLGLRVEKKIGDHFYYFAGLYNGEGQNRADTNDQKDAALRLEAYPIKGLTLGAVGYLGIGERDEPGTKDRVEGDVRVELGEALLQAEYIRGWDGPKGARTKSHGFYGALAYTFFEKLQPAVRVGHLDGDLDTDDDAVNHYEAALNYYISGQEARLAASYSIFDRQGGGDSAEIIAAAQVSF